MSPKPRVAVISPFLDKSHGTERCVGEQIERLGDSYEIHLYSAAVEDVDLSKITYHHIPRFPGPHLVRYLWFFAANHIRRWWDRRFRGLDFDLVFSPGINCLDADIIGVHIVFAEFYRLAHQELNLRHSPLRAWPWLIHRRMSYRFFMMLEKKIYTREEVSLIIISHKMEKDIARCFNRTSRLSLVYHGVDLEHLNPSTRSSLRGEVRKQLQLPDTAFGILLVGNDWRKKGLPCLLEAVARLRNQDLRILVRGTDQSSLCRELIERHGLKQRVMILPPVPDVERHYAASDMYVGPSLEDSFAIPPLEAMACGLPVIVSRQAGASEIVTHGFDGFVLEDPRDPEELAKLIDRICTDANLRQFVGARAAETARRYSWQRNAQEAKEAFDKCLREKRQNRAALKTVVEQT